MNLYFTYSIFLSCCKRGNVQHIKQISNTQRHEETLVYKDALRVFQSKI